MCHPALGRRGESHRHRTVRQVLSVRTCRSWREKSTGKGGEAQAWDFNPLIYAASTAWASKATPRRLREPAIAPDVTLGKRCARLNLRRQADREVFEQLLSEADVLVHGYRRDALEALGLDAAARQAIRPGLGTAICKPAWL